MTNFTQYLSDHFLTLYKGDKDGFDEAFDTWLSGLDVGEVVSLGDKYGKETAFEIGKDVILMSYGIRTAEDADDFRERIFQEYIDTLEREISGKGK